MIQLTPQMRLLLAVEPVDFRKGNYSGQNAGEGIEAQDF